MSDQRAVIKKVKAYPFKGSIKIGDAGTPMVMHVMKLTTTGLIIELAGTDLQPGDKLEVTFETPVLHGHVRASGVVVKLYNQLTGGSTAGMSEAIRLVEIHFRSISNEAMGHVSSFLQQTGQLKASR